jgi:23S rRNA pseudouridine1911/1915/1917 synthase
VSNGACILFEDDDLLAVDKPAGLVAHPCYKHPDGTLFDALVAHLHGTGVRPRLLQRLDKGTSGVMLVSKSMKAHSLVIRAMGRGELQKEYLAVVHGVPEPESGEISLRLRRDPGDSRRVAASETDGKASVTRYRVAAAPAGRATLVLCEPLTGRMHQIRVHLAARGWPIVGDPVYGPSSAAGAQLGRQALHAWRTSLRHPVTGAPLVVSAPIPSDLQTLLTAAGLSLPV